MSTKPKLAERPFQEIARYDGDFFAWAMDQARLLEARRADALDWTNLAEEIRSVGNAEKSEIENRLLVLLVHLLKWQYQPSGRKGGWAATIREQRRRITKRILQSPSLRTYPGEVLDEEYADARLNAADETGLAENVFPKACPYTIEQVLDGDFWPEPSS
jgi:hypothetical protein